MISHIEVEIRNRKTASKCNFLTGTLPYIRLPSASATPTKVFMYNCSDMNLVHRTGTNVSRMLHTQLVNTRGTPFYERLCYILALIYGGWFVPFRLFVPATILITFNIEIMIVMFRSKVCTFVSIIVFGPGHAKMCLMPYANNKGADQPARPRSLISTFIVRC